MTKVSQNQNESAEQQKILRKLFVEHKEIAAKCSQFLKLEEFSAHISNSQSLIDKMMKYEDRFEESINLIDNPNKAKS